MISWRSGRRLRGGRYEAPHRCCCRVHTPDMRSKVPIRRMQGRGAKKFLSSMLYRPVQKPGDMRKYAT